MISSQLDTVYWHAYYKSPVGLEDLSEPKVYIFKECYLT